MARLAQRVTQGVRRAAVVGITAAAAITISGTGASADVASSFNADAGRSTSASQPAKAPLECLSGFVVSNGFNVGAWATCVEGNGQFRIKVFCTTSSGRIYDRYGDWSQIRWYPTWSTRHCDNSDLAVGKTIELA